MIQVVLLPNLSPSTQHFGTFFGLLQFPPSALLITVDLQTVPDDGIDSEWTMGVLFFRTCVQYLPKSQLARCLCCGPDPTINPDLSHVVWICTSSPKSKNYVIRNGHFHLCALLEFGRKG